MALPGEWLLTNGLGGYALGPLEGPPTRGYHGFLVAATQPPDSRMLLVGQVETWLEVDDDAVRLDPYRATADAPDPETPPAETTTPGGTLAIRWPDVRGSAIELRTWMVRDANATVLRWRRLDEDGSRRVRLDLTPLVACRDHHPGGDDAGPPATTIDNDPWPSAAVEWGAGRPGLRMAASGGTVRAADRLVPVHHAEDAARGTSPDQVLHAVASFGADLGPGGELVLVLDTESGSIATLPAPFAAGDGLATVLERADGLVARAGLEAEDATGAGLVLAADRFIVRRRTDPAAQPDADPGRTIIAGYPWFGDWGRDTMISLPGLAIATGRLDEAAGILRTWAGLVHDGLLPNLFPEAGGGEPAYHSVDAPLWFIHALAEHEAATGDPGLASELRPAVEAIIAGYRDGTRFGIGVDPADGLVHAGEGDVQPTWMDAKVDGVPITPRHGKPVEIQALWVNALLLAARWARLAGAEADAQGHEVAATRAETSFRARFPRPELGWLADVVDGPTGDDASLRPNQLLALSLPHPLVDAAMAGRVLDAVERHLVVPGAVRTLAPFEPGYRRTFQGPPSVRDSAYHQGTAWTWLLGPWIDAVGRFRGPDAARRAIESALDALDPAGTGAIPELLEPEPPHEPRGCPWQAWGVAEVLRARRRWAP